MRRRSGLWTVLLWTDALVGRPSGHDGAMTSGESARPRARAFWSDTRFLLGIVLVVASIAGVWAVVAAARHTVPVFAASRTIVPGERVAPRDLTLVDVALGDTANAYVATASLPSDAVATRTITAGELVPQAAISSEHAIRTTTVVLHSDGDVPSSVVTGAHVEVWAAAPLEQGRFDTPRVLVDQATVLSVTRDDSVMAGAGVSLEVVIDRSQVAATLAAVAGGASISVVPAGGPLP